MLYRILTKNGVENTNIDGARGEYFNSGGRSGIVKGVLNEGTFNSSSSNSVFLDTCELRICGHRIVIDEPVYQTLVTNPITNIRWSYIAQIIVDDNKNVDFKILLQETNKSLIQDDLFKTENGSGTYQLEIGRFTQQTSGIITDITRTADLITGGIGYGTSDKINIGNVTTNTIDSGMEAEVDIEERYDTQSKKTYTDFNFNIPRGLDGIDGSGANPNLLLNGGFRINQQNKSIYTVSGQYCVDNWILWYGTLTVNQNGSVTHTSNNTWQGLLQHISKPSIWAGKTVTLSCLCESIQRKYIQLSLKKQGSSETIKIAAKYSDNVGKELLSFTISLPSDLTDNDDLFVMLYTPIASQEITYYWCKLEIGNERTSFLPQSYEKDLVECQTRYSTTFSNPNLIINGDFKINQRGQDSYSEHNKYAVDRWKLFNNGAFDVATKTLTNLASDNSLFFIQTFENNLLNKDLSLSCVIDGIKYSASVTTKDSYSNNSKVLSIGSNKATFEIGYNNRYGIFVQFRVLANNSVTIDDCKLEYGLIPTPFVPRLYGEELALCQRYYYKWKTHIDYGIFTTLFSNWTANSFTTNLSLPTTMRITPTVKMNGNFRLNFNGDTTTEEVVSMGNFSYDTREIGFNCKVTTGKSWTMATLQSNNDINASIEFDAEMY